ncbi:cellulase family glycosylhydrolase [Gordonia sp. HY285]|nr:cellulase family glycosylhydrolase [Gordonia liuliyuniae]MCF8610334.1 cellulase family glycosylhydrolase [Gordonia liuliyuniae]
MVDQFGRVVLVHGLNLVWKHKPYVPPPTAQGFTDKDAEWLYDHGFNGARLGTLWTGVTPDRPGVEDPSYLDRWQPVVNALAERRIWMQFDFHQDMWHEKYGGEGAPDWATHRPEPFARSAIASAPFPMGYWMPELSTVYDNFWANKNGVLDQFARAWAITANRYKDQPYSMGYDLMNEPWAGIEGMTCLIDGCPDTYRNELQPAFEKALRAVRTVDPNNIVWFEPQQFAGGQRLDTFFTPVDGEQNLGFSWHNYCPDVFAESQGLPAGNMQGCRSFSTDRNQHALDQGRRMNATTLMSEWGATDNTTAIGIDADVADRHLMGWMHWAYKKWGDPTTADGDQGLFVDDSDLQSTKKDKLRRLVRTYPQATAGIPKRLRFDTNTGDFTYTYEPGNADAPTEIFVSPLHYKHGPAITVDGGTVTNGLTDNRIQITASGNKPVTVTIKDHS